MWNASKNLSHGRSLWNALHAEPATRPLALLFVGRLARLSLRSLALKGKKQRSRRNHAVVCQRWIGMKPSRFSSCNVPIA
jgi:hypothetical protein